MQKRPSIPPSLDELYDYLEAEIIKDAKGAAKRWHMPQCPYCCTSPRKLLDECQADIADLALEIMQISFRAIGLFRLGVESQPDILGLVHAHMREELPVIKG